MSTEPAAAQSAQLSEILSQGLSQLGTALEREREERLKSVHGFSGPLTGLSQAVELVRAKCTAKLQLGIATINNMGRSNVNTFNVSGSVGSIQTGHNSTATVTQTVEAASRDQAIEALARIEELLRQGISGQAGAEAVEVVADLREQVLREMPNKLKVSTLLGGLATVVQTVPQLGPAWDTLTRWGTTLRDAGAAIIG